MRVMARHLIGGWPIPVEGGRRSIAVTLCSSRVTSVCRAGSPESKDIFQRHSFVRLVELPSLAAPKSSQAAFKAAGPTIFQNEFIHGVVRPDLPPKASWVQLLPLLGLTQHLASSTSFKPAEDGWSASPASRDSSPAQELENLVRRHWQVRTVAAHTATVPDLCTRIVETAASIEAHGGGGSLLLLTGEHAFRKWGLVNKLLPGDSFAMLKAASSLRQKGYLPAGIQLWAVENPLTNPVCRLEQKIASGAEAIILQPPLLSGQFQDWWAAADRKGLLKSAHVIVGLPIISSAKNLSFWLQLTGAKGEEAASLLAGFQRAESSQSAEEAHQFCVDWNCKLIQGIKMLPGMHVMPVTPWGWRQLCAFVADGKI